MDLPPRPRNGLHTDLTPGSPVRVAAVVVRGHLRVVLQGDVDVAAGPALAALHEVVASHGLPVVVDASRVTFLDCSGLSAVLELGRGAPSISLRGTSPAVDLLLRLTDDLGEGQAVDLDGLVVEVDLDGLVVEPVPGT
jgi:anti-anti-sigma factor